MKSVTAMLAAMILITFAIQLSTGEPDSWYTLDRVGAASPERVWDGQVWRYLTAALVHTGWLHLAFNLYWLWVLGRLVEKLMGPTAYLLFALGAAVVSAAAMTIAGGAGAGFSGVGYGVFGYLLARRRSDPTVAKIVRADVIVLFLGWIAAGFLLKRVGLAPVANVAHVAGLAYGFGVGAGRRWAVGVYVVCAAAVVYSLFPVHSARWHLHRGDYRRALELDPSLEWTLKDVANHHGLTGRLDEARAAVEAGFRADDPAWVALAEKAFKHAGTLEQMEAAARRMAAEGRHAEARWFCDAVVDLNPARGKAIRAELGYGPGERG